jgi:LacI family transcriptional regulator
VLLPWRPSSGHLSHAAAVAGVSQHNLGVDTVVAENNAGVRRLAEHVLSLGHRQIAVLAGLTNLLTARERTSGFRRALADAGMNNVQMVHGPFTWDGGNGAAKAVVAGSSRVTCMLAVNDVMAMGALAALRDASISVPQEISVAGLMTCRRCATPRPR